MKRIFCLILAALLLTGCGNAADPSETAGGVQESVETAETLSDETEAPESDSSFAEGDTVDAAAKSPNYTVNSAMMNYFFRVTCEQYASMAVYYGMSAATSMKEQECMIYDGTWFDFFAAECRGYVSDALSLCEAAGDKGISLDEADYGKIDDKIADLNSQAAQYGCNLNQLLYILFNCNLTEQDLRKCLEIAALADKVAAEYDDSFGELTADELEKYYRNHAEDFVCVDILSCPVYTSDFTDSEEKTAAEAAKEYVDRLTAAASPEEFTSVAEEYIRLANSADEAEIEARIADLLIPKVHLYNIADENLANWAFEGEKGSSYSFQYDETLTDVLYLASDPYRDQSKTRHFRHILIAAESYNSDEEAIAAAEAAYFEWEASGFDAAKFAELCDLYSSDTATIRDGGLYENVAPDTLVEELDAWLFDSSRALGDHALIESISGWHIVEYAGESDLSAWEAEVRTAIISEAYEAMLAEYAETVTFNDDVINAINA